MLPVDKGDKEEKKKPLAKAHPLPHDRHQLALQNWRLKTSYNCMCTVYTHVFKPYFLYLTQQTVSCGSGSKIIKHEIHGHWPLTIAQYMSISIIRTLAIIISLIFFFRRLLGFNDYHPLPTWKLLHWRGVIVAGLRGPNIIITAASFVFLLKLDINVQKTNKGMITLKGSA